MNCEITHHADRRSPIGSTNGGVYWSDTFQLSVSQRVNSARSTASFVGSTCVHSGVSSFSTISVLTCRSSLGSAAPSALVSGNDRSRLPPKLNSARMLPASISSGSTAQGQSPTMPLTSGRTFEPGVNALASGLVVMRSNCARNPGWNHAPPGRFIEPVRIMISQANHWVRLPPTDIVMPVPVSIATRRCAADRVEQVLEVLLRDVGDRCGRRAVVAVECGAKVVESVDPLLRDRTARRR